MDEDPIYNYFLNKYPHIDEEYIERLAQKAREQEREHEELELEERHLNEWNAHPLGRRNILHERQRNEWRELRDRRDIHQRNPIRNQRILHRLEREEPEYERELLIQAEQERRAERRNARGRNQNMIDQWDRERPANWEREMEERWERQRVQELAAEQLRNLGVLNIDAAPHIGYLRLGHEDANAISYEDFKNGDICVRLQQDNRFIFHIDGLKEWFRRSNLNPLTNLPVVQDDIERFTYKDARRINISGGKRKRKTKRKAKKSRKSKI